MLPDQKLYYVVKDFFSDAHKMRYHFNCHFEHPNTHQEEHQVWNYWYVPGLYTYLKTYAGKIIAPEILAHFVQNLQNWAITNVGFTHITPPTLSVYINGCRQGLHNDAHNGRWAYVYSLTDWENKLFNGGETILFKKENYWDVDKCTIPCAGPAFYDLVEPRFNQLLVFDDRVIHGVEPIEGTMNPLEGRIVLHGHISEGKTIVESTHSEKAEITKIIDHATYELTKHIGSLNTGCVGCISFRLVVETNGNTSQIIVLTNQISRTKQDAVSPHELTEYLLGCIKNIKFPSGGNSSITFSMGV